jgi:DNA-binding transcriptional LysR family regulator
LPDSSLIAIRVGSIRRVVCGSPSYFAARGTPKSPGELRTHDCISFEGLSSPDGWHFAAGASTASVAVHARLAVNTAEAAIDAAVAGIGLTRVFSYQVASALQTRALALALEPFELAPWPVSLVHAIAAQAARLHRFRRAAPESQASRAVLEHV